jgi:hypothetical protein
MTHSRGLLSKHRGNPKSSTCTIRGR